MTAITAAGVLANWEKKRKDNEAKFVEATKNELDRIVGS